MLFIYFPTLILAYIAGMTLLWVEAGQRGLPRRVILDMSIWAFFAALIGSKLFHVLFDGFLDYYLREPWEALWLWRGGQVFYGGLLFGLGAALWIAWRHRVPLKPFLDALAPALMLGLAIGRVGCYLAGCCYGRPTELPWGIQYGSGYPATLAQIKAGLLVPEAHYCLPIHPTPLYESGFAFVLCLTSLAINRKRRWKPGSNFLLILAAYALGRFGLEYLRADPRGSLFFPWLTTSQAMSVCLVAITGFIFLGRWWCARRAVR